MVKHAPGQPVGLAVEVTSGVVRAAVVNPLPIQVGNGSGGTTSFRGGEMSLDGDNRTVEDTGHGVRGMTERAELLKGALRAGPHAGSWMVEATIPLEDSGP